MRKVTTTVAAALVAFSFAACNKTNNSVTPEPQGAVTSAKITFVENGTRAVTDGQNNAPGLDEESNVTNASFFTGDESRPVSLTEIEDFTATGAEEAKAYESSVFEYRGTVDSPINSGLVVNMNDLTPADFDADNTIAIEQLGTLSASDAFVMSGKTTEEITIKGGVKSNEVTADNNTFTYTVERVVSKAQVSAPAGGIENNIKDGAADFSDATLSNTRYAVAGSAKKVYLFADNAGDRTLDVTNQNYGTFKSAIHDLPVSTFNNGVFASQRDLQRVSDLTLKTLSGDKDFSKLNSLPVVADADYQTKSNENGIFFLENSVNKTITGNSQIDYSDIAYVKIYTEFKPAKVYKLNGDAIEEAVEDDFKDFDEVVEVSTEWVDKLTDADKTRIGNNLSEKKTRTIKEAQGEDPAVTEDYYELTMHVKKGSVYYSPSTKKFYLSPKAARFDKAGKTIVYLAGKMLWTTPANAQIAKGADFHHFLDTRRNNIYSLLIKEITGLGLNFDPADTTDPNAPKPNPEDNPDEKDHEDKHDVDPATTHLKIQAKILKWNLVYRGVTLDGQRL